MCCGRVVGVAVVVNHHNTHGTFLSTVKEMRLRKRGEDAGNTRCFLRGKKPEFAYKSSELRFFFA